MYQLFGAGLAKKLPRGPALSAGSFSRTKWRDIDTPSVFWLAFLFSSSLFTPRHFMVTKDHAAPEAVPDKQVPFYGNKMGHFIISEQCHIDELR